MRVRERHLVVEKTARIALLGEATPNVREVWIACHGFGQLAARFLRHFETIAAPHRLIVAPEALNRFYLDGRIGPHGPDAAVGATWMTREDRLTEIDDYVRYLDRVHDDVFAAVDRARVRLVALGFSQGVATICRWAARTAARIDELILWAGSLPPELVPAPDLFGPARLSLVFGDDDASAPPAALAEHAAKLAAGNLPFRELRFAGGHGLDGATLRRLAEGA